MVSEKEEGKAEAKEPVTKPAAEIAYQATDIQLEFLELLKSYPIKNPETIVDYIASQGEKVLEDSGKLAVALAETEISPVRRKQVLKHWCNKKGISLSEESIQKVASRQDREEQEKKEKEADRIYAVDPATGGIRLAAKDEKATTLIEAQRLQRLIKKDLSEMEEREGGGKKAPAFILGEGGAWTLNPQAKIGVGEFAIFQMYQDSLRKGEPIDPVEELTKQAEQQVRLKEAMGVKAGAEDTEMGILEKLEKLGMLKKGDEGGSLEIIKVLGELGVLKKGEEGRGSDLEVISTLDGLGLLRKHGEEGRTSDLDVMSKLDALGLLRKTGEEGRTSDLDVITKLDALGLLRKSGEEGRTSDLDVMSKLDALGLLRKSGEGEGSETIKSLQMEVRELKDSLQKQEMDNVKNVVVSLSNQIGDLRKEISTQGRLEGRYALMDKTITAIDNQLSGLRSDARPVLDTLAHRGVGPGASMKSPGDKARVVKGLKEAIALEKEAHALEDELVFNVKKD